MHPIHQEAAGGVVIRRAKKGHEVCLVLRNRHRIDEWCLPKGHLHVGETQMAAALREVHEETGLICEVSRPLSDIAYQFCDAAGLLIKKKVSFFLMRARDSNMRDRDREEVIKVSWLRFDDALNLATHENERRVLLEAKTYLTRAAQ